MIRLLLCTARAQLQRMAGTFTSRLGVALLFTLTQQGCASLASERALFSEGWHPGRIVRVDAGAAMGPLIRSDCRKEMAPQIALQSHFALVRYSVSTSRYGERIAPLTDTPSFHAGDRVYVNIRECRAPMKAPAMLRSTGVR